MYWLLNCLPIIIEVLYAIFTYFGNNSQSSVFTFIAAIWMFVVMPMYLLFVNFHYININETSYIKASILVVIICTIRVIYMLIFHWLKYGNFIGDIPMQIYQSMIIIPSIIVLTGFIIHYFVKRGIS